MILSLRSRKQGTSKRRKFKIDGSSKRVVDYWIDCLVEGDRCSIERQELSDGVELPLKDIVHGMSGTYCFDRLSETAKSRERDSAPRMEDRIRVLICPVRGEKANRDDPGPRFVEAFWIPAVLSQSGQLFPPTAGLPWIPRDHLDPPTSNECVTIATLAAVEKLTAEGEDAEFRSWGEYWEYVERFMKKTIGGNLNSLELDGYRRRPHAIVVRDTQSHASSEALKRLLTEVRDGDRPRGVIATMASIQEPKATRQFVSKDAVLRATRMHCGQFGDAFPLAPSQRLAVHRFFETPEDNFVCITGPPGTGKTTLIQSVIASAWVKAARSGLQPPIIVAIGATNQSVMNVIDSLESAASSHGALAERWLPGVHSYGSFCCSATKAKTVQGYHLELRDGTGLSFELENEDYLRSAQKYFLERATAYLGRRVTVEEAVSIFRKQVSAEFGELYRLSARMIRPSILDTVRHLLSMSSNLDVETLFPDLSTLDQTHRHKAFLFAAHYWEARWLLEARAELTYRANEAGKRIRFRGELHDWQRRAMVTPAFVSTLSMLPRFFASQTRFERAPIDVLIVDEAGQAAVEPGVACLSLARRALIVGDTAQLEPVWNVPSNVDRSLAEKHRLLKRHDAGRWKELNVRGILASSSSLMYLAMRSVKRIELAANQERRAVLLREQRRSVPELVRFCNTLCYGDRLQPKRTSRAKPLVPPFAYMDVRGTAQQLGQSRWNALEVERIGGWLEANHARISQFYGDRPLAEILAVISPFAAQIRKLEHRLGKRYPGMTIGTVHSLQGAEREIVLFSAVYDPTFTGTYFFDRSPNMLNVAVSRAKDSFVIFGDMRIFNPTGQAPSSVLARFLLADEANKLAGAEVDMPLMSDEATHRIDTLAGHREALAEAFATPKKRLIIVSPTISIFAIRSDNVVGLVRSAVERGVTVVIYTDATMDLEGDQLKQSSAEGRQALVDAGATLYVTRKIHNKAVAIDDHTLIEGSFNWLSAVRSTEGQFQKLEVSIRYTGSKVADAIRRLEGELQHRARLWGAEQNP